LVVKKNKKEDKKKHTTRRSFFIEKESRWHWNVSVVGRKGEDMG
jgi:hypothetical protein